MPQKNAISSNFSFRQLLDVAFSIHSLTSETCGISFVHDPSTLVPSPGYESETFMSEDLLAFLIAVAILAGLALWVPFSGFCNDRCQQWLLARRARRSVSVRTEQREESKVVEAA